MGNPDSKDKKAYTDAEDAYESSAAGPSSFISDPNAPLLSDFPPDGELPPAYSDTSPLHNDTASPLYSDDPPAFEHYTPSKRSLTTAKSVTHDARLNSDADALYAWLLSETHTPPHPLLKITGWHRAVHTTHTDGKSTTETHTVTDFDMTISLFSFLALDAATRRIVPGVLSVADPSAPRFRGTIRKHPDPADTPLLDYCRQYVRSRRGCKEFCLRKVPRMDMAVLEDHIERAVRATNYRGNIAVKFPVEQGTVVLVPGTWTNTIRYGPWRWAFYISFLWILIWPVLWVLTKRWDVAECVWRAEDGVEMAWVDEWGHTVGALARGRRNGKVTYSEMVGIRMALERGANRGAGSRVASSGTGAAARLGGWVGGFLSGLAEAGESLQGGWGGDETGWGGTWDDPFRRNRNRFGRNQNHCHRRC